MKINYIYITNVSYDIQLILLVFAGSPKKPIVVLLF